MLCLAVFLLPTMAYAEESAPEAGAAQTTTEPESSEQETPEQGSAAEEEPAEQEPAPAEDATAPGEPAGEPADPQNPATPEVIIVGPSEPIIIDMTPQSVEHVVVEKPAEELPAVEMPNVTLNIPDEKVPLAVERPDAGTWAGTSLAFAGAQGGVSLIALVWLVRPRLRDVMLGATVVPAVAAVETVAGMPVMLWKGIVLGAGLIGPCAFLATGDVTSGLQATAVDWLTIPLMALTLLQVLGVLLLRKAGLFKRNEKPQSN
jgi:hypothetical protein